LITFLYLDTGLANDDFGLYRHTDGDLVDEIIQIWAQRTSSTQQVFTFTIYVVLEQGYSYGLLKESVSENFLNLSLSFVF